MDFLGFPTAEFMTPPPHPTPSLFLDHLKRSPLSLTPLHVTPATTPHGQDGGFNATTHLIDYGMATAYASRVGHTVS